MKIIILTKNILAEQLLQEKLQRLNYEVFVSSHLFQPGNSQETVTAMIEYFPFIIFSETLSDAETLSILSLIEVQKHKIYRKGAKGLKRVDQEYWQEKGIHGWLLQSFEIEEIRELFSQAIAKQQTLQLLKPLSTERVVPSSKIRRPQREKDPMRLDECGFRNNERKIIEALASERGQIVSREKLCLILWDKEATNSKLAQLSYLVKGIKQRFNDLGIHIELLQTSWGKGYSLTSTFYDYFSLEEVQKTEEALY
ncbi:transcriptional regulator [Enterococcus florum]|uniref:Transcriptional regulator n=1 Tax=Enterococcus florum TaxID=2480627 RepID=A0A4V0WPW3_9ENTE|nr:helix-turn-helix domain-containing protein [Enterococcus florum]GCF95259.1 transcriptional regulator [Enterococcus florum]